MGDMRIEKSIEALESKILELEKISRDQKIDLSDELKPLIEKLESLKKENQVTVSAWDRVQLARRPERPTSLDYIEKMVDGFIELHGDRYFGDDPAIVAGVGRIGGLPVTVIGEQKGRNTKDNIKRNFGMPNPEGYRKALRLMKQSEKFCRPILCLIDTPGAYPGLGAEERGQGEAIARNLMEMSAINVPILSIVIAEGGSGGALALGVADSVWMLENSIYSILSPEGFASILWKDGGRAREASEMMKLTAADLKEFGIVDRVITEPMGGAHKDLEGMCETLKAEIVEEFKRQFKIADEQRLQNRYDKYRKMGKFKD